MTPLGSGAEAARQAAVLPGLVDMKSTVLAFRGYNITNLGRTPELLAHTEYGPVVAECLREASSVCADTIGRKVNLVDRVRRRRETSLKTYHEAVALVVATEMAQLECLSRFHEVGWSDAKFSFGYSLGEISALIAGRYMAIDDVLRVLISMCPDSVSLAADVSMAVVFSRGAALAIDDVERLCHRIAAEGNGSLGISAILSPNTVLLLGQGDTVERFAAIRSTLLPPGVHVRINPHRWPPLHTPIIRQSNIPNRTYVRLERIAGFETPPRPPVFSLVTGKPDYNDGHGRELIQNWIDHPQRLWDAVCHVLQSGAKTVLHVGPEPNLIPATFKRLSDNVRQQASGRVLSGMMIRAFSGFASRIWLERMLPKRTFLLRAPEIRHVILEDWLLDKQEK